MSSKHRILSLSPATTEALIALKFEEALIGRSHRCDYPATIESLPVCTKSHYNEALDSGQISKALQKLQTENQAPITLLRDVLAKQAPPTLIIVNQNDIIGLPATQIRQGLPRQIEYVSIPILSYAPTHLSTVWEGIRTISGTLGIPSHGEVVIATMRGRMEAIATRARTASVKLQTPPKVLCLTWLEPLEVAGWWIPEMVELLGAESCCNEVGTDPQQIEWEDIVNINPDIIIVMPRGMNDHRARREMALLTRKSEWKTLKAVQDETVYLADGNTFFNRPGPRLVESLEILAEIIHPEAFSFGHLYKGWQRFSLRELFR